VPKKLLRLSVLVLMFIVLFTAIGSAKTVVTHWIYPLGPTVEEEFAKLKDEFEAANPDINVQIELQPWGNRYPKLFAALASGQGPDCGLLTVDAMIKFADADMLLPLDDKLPKAYWDDIDPGILEQVTYQGRVYYAPFDKESSGLLYNTKIFAEAGLDSENPDFTWSGIDAICSKVKPLGYFGWGYNAASPTVNWSFWPFLHQAGGQRFNGAGTEVAFNSPAGVEALDYIVSLFDKGYVSKTWLTNDQATFFFEGKQAINMLHSSKSVVTLRQDNPDLANFIKVGPPPTHKVTAGFGAARSFVVFKQAEDPEAAAKWVEFISRSEVQRLLSTSVSGQVPASISAREGLFADDPPLRKYVDYAPYALDEALHEYGRDIMPFVVSAVQAAILHQRTPEQALNEAAAKANDVLLGK